jgi:hypothetical protein
MMNGWVFVFWQITAKFRSPSSLYNSSPSKETLLCDGRTIMFVLKELGRMIWGNPDKTEIVQINSGQLYLVRPKNSLKGTSECMYAEFPALD